MEHNEANPKLSRFKTAFSIAEFSIILVIIAMILGMSFSVFNNNNDPLKNEITNSKLTIIEEAIIGYILANKRLPCPAIGSLNYNNANYGVENCTSFDLSTANIAGGVVPAQTLGLPKDYILDGWNRKISYFVSRNQIQTHNVHFPSSLIFGITYSETGSTYAFDLLYALVSHGPKAQGAWLKNGGTRLAGRPDSFNIPLDSDYIYVDYAYNSDELIRFIDRKQFFIKTGLLLSRACIEARNMSLNANLNIYCQIGSGSYDNLCKSNLQSIAAKLGELCLGN